MRIRPLIAVVALTILVPAAAGGANLLANAGFDSASTGWSSQFPYITGGWSSFDVAGDPLSGSVRVRNTAADDRTGAGLDQCLPATPGARYDLGAWIMLPAQQGATGYGALQIIWYSGVGCSGPMLTDGGTDTGARQPGDRWTLHQALSFEAPPATQSVRVILFVMKDQEGGSLSALFDDVRFCPATTCGLQRGGSLSTAELPGFRFRLTVEGANAAIPGIREPLCLAETLCVSGALPGRVEALLRVIGPRPNGYFWFQVVRFTPARLIVEAEQLGTGQVRQYVLEAVAADRRPTNLEDRTAFLP